MLLSFERINKFFYQGLATHKYLLLHIYYLSTRVKWFPNKDNNENNSLYLEKRILPLPSLALLQRTRPTPDSWANQHPCAGNIRP